MPTCLLVDNGSLRASSTLNLRAIANQLERQTGQVVAPVSLLHSSAVDPDSLGGQPAEIIQPALLQRLAEGETEFVVLPLFFGPSLAISDYLPKRIAAIRKTYPELKVWVAPCLFDEQDGTDLRLAGILRDRVEEVLQPDEKPPVILLDHGSPAPRVTYVRNFIAGQLSVLLQGKVAPIIGASMERRPGDEYRFSGPLLEKVLGTTGFNRGRVVVAMMFLSPGRHAGEGGDVAGICRRAEELTPGLEVVRTRLVGDHPGLISILSDRLRQVLEVVENETRGGGSVVNAPS